VGHINRNRNIELLSRITELEDVQILLLGSTSTSHDESLVHELSRNNVKIIRNYLPHVEEVYQLADIYLFPVKSEGAAVGVPLSVLEAMACNLPIICTSFGGLPLLFKAGEGVFYYDNEAELPQLISDIKGGPMYSTRGRVEPYAWKNVARIAMDMIASREVLQ
jgi:glycosyltransferase involved in cell wall biosynthesis